MSATVSVIEIAQPTERQIRAAWKRQSENRLTDAWIRNQRSDRLFALVVMAVAHVKHRREVAKTRAGRHDLARAEKIVRIARAYSREQIREWTAVTEDDGRDFADREQMIAIWTAINIAARDCRVAA